MAYTSLGHSLGQFMRLAINTFQNVWKPNLAFGEFIHENVFDYVFREIATILFRDDTCNKLKLNLYQNSDTFIEYVVCKMFFISSRPHYVNDHLHYLLCFGKYLEIYSSWNNGVHFTR